MKERREGGKRGSRERERGEGSAASEESRFLPVTTELQNRTEATSPCFNNRYIPHTLAQTPSGG